MERKVCGEGAYGKVYNIGHGKAQKSFQNLCSLVQEYVALRYVKGWKHVLQGYDANFSKKTLDMDLCDNSLRGYMDSTKEPSIGVKMTLFKDILTGLLQLHKNGIIHADLKPGNILIKDHRALLGDLGFVNIQKYARVYNTARNYRDPAKKADYGHDLFSLGIVLAEILLWRRVNKKKLDHEIKKIEDEKMVKLIKLLVSEDRKKRPNIEEIFKHYLNEDVPEIYVNDKPQHNIKFDKEWAESIKEYMRKHCQAFYIRRGLTGYKALLTFLSCNKTDSSLIPLYVPCTIMILSSIFGQSGYTEEEVFKSCHRRGFKEKDVLSAIKDLCDNAHFVNILFMKSK